MRDFPSHSVVTPLKGLPGVFLKRDDELHPAGSKIRKLATLIPALVANKSRPVWLLGSMNGNSVLAAVPLFRQAGLTFRVLTPRYSQLYSNGILASQILYPSEIKKVLPCAAPMAAQALARLAAAGQLALVAEGLDHPAAYEGAASLAADLRRNELAIGQQLDHVFVDSGSGLMAAALIAGDLRLGRIRQYHIVLAAGDEELVIRQLLQVTARLLPDAPPTDQALRALPIRFYQPKVGRSFGSTPAVVWRTIHEVARLEGVLLDPLYTAKTYQVMAEVSSSLSGTKVMIHSGGLSSLGGFLPKLAALV